MKYYKNTNGEFFAFEEDESQDYLITEDMTLSSIEDVYYKTPDELIQQSKDNFIIMTDAHIQAEVTKYNESNNVMFGSIHNCSTYITVDTYPHQSFCIAIIKWNADVWETVRAITTLPTEAEFQAILDGVVFNG